MYHQINHNQLKGFLLRRATLEVVSLDFFRAARPSALRAIPLGSLGRFRPGGSFGIDGSDFLIFVPVEFLWQTRVQVRFLRFLQFLLALERFRSPLSQVFLEDDGVAGVALVHCICKVS